MQKRRTAGLPGVQPGCSGLLPGLWLASSACWELAPPAAAPPPASPSARAVPQMNRSRVAAGKPPRMPGKKLSSNFYPASLPKHAGGGRQGAARPCMGESPPSVSLGERCARRRHTHLYRTSTMYHTSAGLLLLLAAQLLLPRCGGCAAPAQLADAVHPALPPRHLQAGCWAPRRPTPPGSWAPRPRGATASATSPAAAASPARTAAAAAARSSPGECVRPQSCPGLLSCGSGEEAGGVGREQQSTRPN